MAPTTTDLLNAMHESGIQLRRIGDTLDRILRLLEENVDELSVESVVATPQRDGGSDGE